MPLHWHNGEGGRENCRGSECLFTGINSGGGGEICRDRECPIIGITGGGGG